MGNVAMWQADPPEVKVGYGSERAEDPRGLLFTGTAHSQVVQVRSGAWQGQPFAYCSELAVAASVSA